MDLLMKTPRLNTRAQTHSLLTQESHEGDEHSTDQHAQKFLHDLNQNCSDGIQSQESCSLKENVTENLQQNPVNPNAAIVLSEEVTTGEIRSEGPSSPRQGHGVIGAVPCPDVDVSSGRISEGPEGVSGCSDHSHSTAGGGQSGRVGNYDHSIGQAPVKDLCHGLREREVLCEPGVEQKGSRAMAEELSTLLSSSPRSQCRTSGTTDAYLTSYDTRGGRSDPCWRSSVVDTTHQRSPDQGEEPEGCSTEGHHQGGERMDTCVRDREGQQEKPAKSEQHYGDTAQCREDCPTASTDRSPAARSQRRADRASMAVGSGLKTLTPDEVAFIQCELQDKSQKIQDGLSKLSSDPIYCGIKKSSEITRERTKFSGKWVSKRVDLLEIYCDEESELTKVRNMKGGRALRFTKEDGDLTTSSGQQKLWTWIEL